MCHVWMSASFPLNSGSVALKWWCMYLWTMIMHMPWNINHEWIGPCSQNDFSSQNMEPRHSSYENDMTRQTCNVTALQTRQTCNVTALQPRHSDYENDMIWQTGDVNNCAAQWGWLHKAVRLASAPFQCLLFLHRHGKEKQLPKTIADMPKLDQGPGPVSVLLMLIHSVYTW